MAFSAKDIGSPKYRTTYSDITFRTTDDFTTVGKLVTRRVLRIFRPTNLQLASLCTSSVKKLVSFLLKWWMFSLLFVCWLFFVLFGGRRVGVEGG